MKKILVYLFSLICLVAYPQRKNENGLKMVKSITRNERNLSEKYVFTYDENGKTKKLELFTKTISDEDPYNLYISFELRDNKLIYLDRFYDKAEKKNIQSFFNKEGYLERYKLTYVDGSVEQYKYIYNEDYVEIKGTDCYFERNLKPKQNGEPAWPWEIKLEHRKYNKFTKYEKLNDTNIPLSELIKGIHMVCIELCLTSWVPYYDPYLPIERDDNMIKYEYIYENDNLIKIHHFHINYEWRKTTIEIEYLY